MAKTSSAEAKVLAEELYARKRAQDNLVDFTKYIDVPGKPASEEESNDWIYESVETGVADHHRLILETMQRVIDGKLPRAMFFLPPGAAKALALNTPIPTPDGWTTMGDIQVGDKVFGDNGRPCNVTWKSRIFTDRPCFDVKTDCGDVIVADNDHEWLVNLCRKPRKSLAEDQDRADGRGLACLSNRGDPMSQHKIKETWELEKKRSKRPMIQRACALSLPEKELLIDPYLLGVWLGDGTSASGAITSSAEDIVWLRPEIEFLGYKTKDRSIDTLFGIEGLQSDLRKLNLLKLPIANAYGHKHIPKDYMRASYEQRLHLLQGLIDSDGTVCKKRGSTTFCNTDIDLAKQVRELVRSLGVKAGWSKSKAMLNGKQCGYCYRVSFYLKGSARLPRKAILTRNQERTPNTYIDVTKTNNADTVCIEVDSDSHLFLAGESMTPTHNSTYCSTVAPTWAMGRQPDTKIILTSYGTDLAKKHGRKARSIVRSKKYQSVFDVTISDETNAADMWAASNGSEYMSAGILSGITGNRAHGIIIDDPLKGRADADSKIIRDRTWDAYQDDIKTRLIPGGWEIVVACLAGDTEILMHDGTLKQICDIKKNDIVLSYDNGKHVQNKVLNHKSQGEDDVFELSAGNRKVRCNAKHPWLVERKNGNREWVRTQDMLNDEGKVKKHLKIVLSRNTPTCLNNNLSLNEAWLLGFMFGDGWITKRDTTQKAIKKYTTASGEVRTYGEGLYPRRGFVTCWAHGDKDHVEKKVVSLFKDIFDAELKRTKFGYYRTDIARIGRWFVNNGLEGKAKTKRLPTWLYSESHETRSAFLDGFVTADGHTNKRRVQVGLCNKELTNDIKNLARSVGHLSTNVFSKMSVQQPPNSPKPIEAWKYDTSWSHSRDTQEEFESVYVTKIVPVGREEVFDIEVENDHNFVAEGIVSHNTRWHLDDLSGRLLPPDYSGESGMVKCQDGRDWYILNLPAICEKKDDPLDREIGDILWPEWFSKEHFAGFQRNNRTWSALFQQRPAPDEGTFFKKDWFHLYQSYELPKDLHYYITSDFATVADDGDYTEHGVWGVDEVGDLWAVDWWNGQTTSDVWINEIIRLMKLHSPLCWFGEGGVIRRAIEPFLTRMMGDDGAYCRIEWVNPVSNKATRARAFQAMASQGKVHIPDSLTGHRIIDQLLVFPVGTHDDAVDVCSLIGMVIDQAHPAIVDRKNEKPKTQAEKDWARIHGVDNDGKTSFNMDVI